MPPILRPELKRFSVSGLFVSLFLALLSTLSARALTFNVTYDASVTSSPNSAQIQSAFAAATQTFQNLYTNAITINLTVYWGATGPFAGGIDLGASETYFVGRSDFKYPQLTNALRAARSSAADSNSVASLPASDPTGGSLNWWIPRAEAKALGVLGMSPTDPANDGDVGFASNVGYTFSATNRAVAGKYDFIGVAEHEISEILGRGFALNYGGFSGYEPNDLFRFTSTGARSFNVADPNVYFSADNGATALKYFYNDVNTGDIQDWQTSSPADVCDAYLVSGQKSTLSSADLTALDILGFNLNFTPPRLTGGRLGNGNFQLTFTNVPGLNFTILGSSNSSLTGTNWTVLGTPTENPAGQYQFTDTPGNTQRYYRVKLN